MRKSPLTLAILALRDEATARTSTTTSPLAVFSRSMMAAWVSFS